MKTRRGFFAALAGAVAAPFLLAKSGVGKALGEKKTTPTAKRWTNINGIWYDDWSVKALLASPPRCQLNVAPYYGLQFHKDAFTLVMEPSPNVNWHRLGQIPLDRTVTVTNPDGTTKTVTINQGEKS